MEDWDNQNIFKICTLKECKGTYISRRQEIGRGLRLCVNQEGERNESYSKLVSGLQSKIERDTNIRL